MENKKRVREISRELASNVAESLGIEESLLSGESVVEMVGRRSLRINNHRGIIKYSPSDIRIRTDSGIFKINGEQLIIKGLMADEILIEGKIANAAYEEG